MVNALSGRGRRRRQRRGCAGGEGGKKVLGSWRENLQHMAKTAEDLKNLSLFGVFYIIIILQII